MKYITILITMLIAIPAVAAENHLTDEKIRKFLEDEKNIKFETIPKRIYFLEEFVHDDAVFEFNTNTTIKGVKPQTEKIKLGKYDVISELKSKYRKTKYEKLNHAVLNIHIDKNGYSAKIKDSTYGVAKVTIYTNKGVLLVKEDISMMCDKKLVLAGEDVLIRSSKCDVEVRKETIKTFRGTR